MSPAPLHADDREGGGRYRAAWRAVMQLAREGRSWSGHERNCAFLNCTPGAPGEVRFASVSALSGLDHPGDGRAVAVSDWDGDGDVDLWFRDRTGPRLRLMANRAADLARERGGEGGTGLRLVGTRCNRDAVGARVTVTCGSGRIVAKTLRAGDGFLSQSSKWLHFGAGSDEVVRVEVAWPGGATETFGGVRSGGRFLLRQGEGKAVPVAGRDQETIVFHAADLERGSGVLPVPADSGVAQVLFPAKVPMPMLEFQDGPGSAPVALEATGRPRLLLFWSAECPTCAAEITRLARSDAPVEVRLVNVDAAAAPNGAGTGSGPFDAAREKLAMLGAATMGSTFATPLTLDKVSHLQRVLFDNHVPFAVPFAILTDGRGDAVALYRGSVPGGVLAHDVGAASAGNRELRDLAVPFPGRWFTNAITPSAMAGMMAGGFARPFPADAAAMLERAIALDPGNPETRCDYGALLAGQGRFSDAEAQLRKALEIRPDYPMARKNLDLVLRSTGRAAE